jgi:hypothetical protein
VTLFVSVVASAYIDNRLLKSIFYSRASNENLYKKAKDFYRFFILFMRLQIDFKHQLAGSDN